MSLPRLRVTRADHVHAPKLPRYPKQRRVMLGFFLSALPLTVGATPWWILGSSGALSSMASALLAGWSAVWVGASVSMLRSLLKPNAFFDDRQWLAVEQAEGVSVTYHGNSLDVEYTRRMYFDRAALVASLPLRVALRRRFGLRIDLGEASPEFVAPSDPPLATWDFADGLPDSSNSEVSQGIFRRDARMMLAWVRCTQPSEHAVQARANASVMTTVVDEAATNGEELVVKEGDDFGRIELDLLREESARNDGAAEFVFGKSTRVVFVEVKGNAVVEVLRRVLAEREADVASEHDQGRKRAR